MAYEFGVGEFETRDGRKAEVFAVRKGLLLGAIYHETYASGIAMMRWNIEGAANNDGRDDLLPPKQTRTVWLNVYDSNTFTHATHKEAIAGRGATCLAIKEVTIEFTPGEGL